MRILITVPTYPPFNSGLGNVVQIQAKLISSLGHDVTVATGGQSGVVRFDEVSNAKIVEFSISGADYIPRPLKGDVTAYAKFLQSNEFDLIILNAWQNWATDIALKNLDVIKGKIVVYSHCVSTNSFLGTSFIRSIVSYLFWRPYWFSFPGKLKRLAGVIYLSEGGCDARFDDLSLSLKLNLKHWVIPNAIPDYAESVMGRKLCTREVRTQITSVASYDWLKGHDFVIRAYAGSSAKNVIPLKIFGQKFTSYTDDLIILADSLGIARNFIEFRQGLVGWELMAEYVKSIVFINGSRSECQPLVLLDAMAAGVPFVSRKSGAIPSLEGGCCVVDDAGAIAALDRLLVDSDYWNHKSRTGRKFIELHHAQDCVKEKFSRFIG